MWGTDEDLTTEAGTEEGATEKDEDGRGDVGGGSCAKYQGVGQWAMQQWVLELQVKWRGKLCANSYD